MEKLLDIIQSLVALNNQQKEQISDDFFNETLHKSDFLITEGQYCNQIAFIVKGKLRIFYNDEHGNEVTCYFVGENEFVSSYTSFLTETPTKENIQAIENTELLIINRDKLESLSIKVPEIQILRRIIAENLFIAMERRITLLQSETAQLRYENLIKENPELVLNVPQQYLASFLGITPQHLSRLRKKMQS